MPRTHPSAATYGATGREVARWVERLARVGYVAKGVVYAVVGVLAAQLAFGTGGQTTGTTGALHTIGSQPWGQGLLALTGIGLACYAIWRFVQGFLDPEHKGTDAEGIVKRLAYVGSGIIHGSLAITAFSLAAGNGGGGGGGSTQSMTAELMSYPWGLWLVGLVGVVTLGIGLRQFYRAYEESFLRKWHTAAMSAEQRRWGTRAGRWGLSARGVVFVMMGFFFIRAAIQHDASEAIGLDGALAKLATTGFGPWVLGVVALGLVAYAVFCFVQARYRHFPAGRGGPPP
jgi:hypothetical protein